MYSQRCLSISTYLGLLDHVEDLSVQRLVAGLCRWGARSAGPAQIGMANEIQQRLLGVAGPRRMSLDSGGVIESEDKKNRRVSAPRRVCRCCELERGERPLELRAG